MVRNIAPPRLQPALPNYPELRQFVRAASPLGGNLYGGVVQQYDGASALRDREICYLFEPNGIVVAPGRYKSRLVGSHAGAWGTLPLYAMSLACCMPQSFSSSSARPTPLTSSSSSAVVLTSSSSAVVPISSSSAVVPTSSSSAVVPTSSSVSPFCCPTLPNFLCGVYGACCDVLPDFLCAAYGIPICGRCLEVHLDYCIAWPSGFSSPFMPLLFTTSGSVTADQNGQCSWQYNDGSIVQMQFSSAGGTSLQILFDFAFGGSANYFVDDVSAWDCNSPLTAVLIGIVTPVTAAPATITINPGACS